MISWLVGERNQITADAFMQDVAARLGNRVQVSSDGLRRYVPAVDSAFGEDVDYGSINKMYAGAGGGRYSPARVRQRETRR